MSLRLRVVLAVALTFGFYALALGLMAAMVWVLFEPNVPGRVLGFCIFGVVVIGISIIPWPRRFVPPGPLLNPAGQAPLFAELQGVASAVGETMPAEVYISPEMNAGVLVRRRRRVMVLGLPLMQVLTVNEMRAVLAHEFGHYHGGDTRLGPWIYRTREAIERIVQNASRQSAILQIPFLWYGRMFMRITQAVSRRQELTADALAARTFGAAAMIGGLRALARGSAAWSAYWRTEVVPLLEAGFQPPIADGFQRFLSEPQVKEGAEKAAQELLSQARSDPYDSHPPDTERIAALGSMPSGPDDPAGPPAATLVNSIEAMLRDYSVGWLPELVKYADRLGRSETAAAGRQLTADQTRSLGVGLAGAAFATALADSGWTAESLPGRPVAMRHGEVTIEPFLEVNRMARGEVDAPAWQQRCVELGIRDLPLAPS